MPPILRDALRLCVAQTIKPNMILDIDFGNRVNHQETASDFIKEAWIPGGASTLMRQHTMKLILVLGRQN
jgi:hypothetical protein